MIRAVANMPAGRKLLLLGLEAENVERLKEGKPIMVRGDQFGLGLNVDVAILYGETAADIYKALKEAGLVGPDTKIEPQ